MDPITSLLQLVADYGPIVYADPELGFCIQRNGSYLNFARQARDGSWEHSDCRSMGDDAYKCTLSQAMDEAKDWADEIVNGPCPECGEDREKDGAGDWQCAACVAGRG